MMPRSLELFYDQLVIGSDLGAFAYCHEHQCPAIYLRMNNPYKYNEKANWERSIPMWNELAFSLSTSNLLPFGDKIVSLRLESDNVLKASTKFSLSCKINFKQLIISDDYQLSGLPPATGKTSNKNWVVDWFDIKRGALHPLDIIEDPSDDFVKRIHFYPSQRFYKNLLKKDLVAVSLIDDADLEEFSHCQSLARFKVVKMMKEAGIKGIWDKSNNRFLVPKVASAKRDIYPLGKNIYKDLPNNISMLY